MVVGVAYWTKTSRTINTTLGLATNIDGDGKSANITLGCYTKSNEPDNRYLYFTRKPGALRAPTFLGPCGAGTLAARAGGLRPPSPPSRDNSLFERGGPSAPIWQAKLSRRPPEKMKY